MRRRGRRIWGRGRSHLQAALVARVYAERRDDLLLGFAEALAETTAELARTKDRVAAVERGLEDVRDEDRADWWRNERDDAAIDHP